jgi:signal transduction histidine kinase
VQGHGGEISIEDTPGGGSTFVMTLPYDAPIDEEAP